MIYLFGKLVTAEEKAFFSKVLATKSDRLEQGKYFKAVYYTARREGVSLMEAHDILTLTEAKTQKLNKKFSNSDRNIYYVDGRGEISKNIRNFCSKHIFKRKVSKQELNDIENGVKVNPTKPKPTFFSEAKQSFKRGWQLFKEALTVY